MHSKPENPPPAQLLEHADEGSAVSDSSAASSEPESPSEPSRDPDSGQSSTFNELGVDWEGPEEIIELEEDRESDTNHIKTSDEKEDGYRTLPGGRVTNVLEVGDGTTMPIAAMKQQRRRSSEELGKQWAGGRDVWINIPADESGDFIASITTKVVAPRQQEELSSSASKSSSWPRIVHDSILFGFGACNPRGQELDPNKPVNTEENQNLHAQLYHDIERVLTTLWDAQLYLDIERVLTTFWESFGVWSDGSFEPGFILAVPRPFEEWGLQLSKKLAEKYDQGAIYRFRFDVSTTIMVRDTIAVLEDKDCEASVEVEIDHNASDKTMDMTRFEEFTKHAMSRRRSAADTKTTSCMGTTTREGSQVS